METMWAPPPANLLSFANDLINKFISDFRNGEKNEEQNTNYFNDFVGVLLNT